MNGRTQSNASLIIIFLFNKLFSLSTYDDDIVYDERLFVFVRMYHFTSFSGLISHQGLGVVDIGVFAYFLAIINIEKNHKQIFNHSGEFIILNMEEERTKKKQTSLKYLPLSRAIIIFKFNSTFNLFYYSFLFIFYC